LNDTLKSIGKRLIWIIITFILLELLLLMALDVIYLLSEVKLNINIDIVLSSLQDLFTSLPSTIQGYIQENNPFFLLGTGAVLIYSIVIHFKGKKKKSDWETQEEGYHGSAKWSKPRDIIDNKNFEAQSKKEIQANFYKSLK